MNQKCCHAIRHRSLYATLLCFLFSLGFIVQTINCRSQQSANSEIPAKRDSMTIQTYNDRDNVLVRAVESAVNEKLPLEKVKTRVGVQPTMITSGNSASKALARARVEIDRDPPNVSPIPVIRSATVVVYWIRPMDSRFPKVIGIAWNEEGKGEIFSGILLPPE